MTKKIVKHDLKAFFIAMLLPPRYSKYSLVLNLVSKFEYFLPIHHFHFVVSKILKQGNFYQSTASDCIRIVLLSNLVVMVSLIIT
jgi:hypothetical protein